MCTKMKKYSFNLELLPYLLNIEVKENKFIKLTCYISVRQIHQNVESQNVLDQNKLATRDIFIPFFYRHFDQFNFIVQILSGIKLHFY